jgi:hypothetical protein
VLGVGRFLAAERAEEWEDVFADNLKHLLGFKVLEPRPAVVVVGPLPGVLPLGKDAPLHRLLGGVRLVLFECVQVVEPLDEEQIGDLLDHFERIGDAT